jgi:hypothetical protein
MRQHLRVSGAHKILQDQILILHKGLTAPKVTHAVTAATGESFVQLPKDHHD